MPEDFCPFCKEEVIMTAFAAEGNYCALYNHAPIVAGHSLIIPRNHLEDVMELNDNDYINLFLFARKVMQFLNFHFKTNEFDMSLQQGVHAGQSVAHTHIHLIPRKPFDLAPGEEWYDKINEHQQYHSLDSDKILKKSDLLNISAELKEKWIQWASDKK